MKAIPVLVAVIGLSLGAPKGLKQDLADLEALLPVDEIIAIFQRYVKSDGAVANAVLYFQGDEWKGLIKDVASKPEVKDLLNHLTKIGLPPQDLLKPISNEIQKAVPEAEPKEGSFAPFFDEVKAIISTEDIRNFINDELDNSAAFQEFLERLSSDESRDLVEEVLGLEEVQRLLQRLGDLGFGGEIDDTLAFVYDLLGWN